MIPAEVYVFLLIVLAAALIYTAVYYLTFSNICPKCKSSKEVKRLKRSFITKYLLFFLHIRKNRCQRCIKTFYQLFDIG
jgi:hypothetical protein